jgi:hypothetical protein
MGAEKIASPPKEKAARRGFFETASPLIHFIGNTLDIFFCRELREFHENVQKIRANS